MDGVAGAVLVIVAEQLELPGMEGCAFACLHIAYDLVWSTPMVKLAEQFGLSDVGLTKICDRHRVTDTVSR